MALMMLSCSSNSSDQDYGGTTDADADADSDADSDTDADTDTEDECAALNCQQECVRFADVEAATGGDGLSWSTAFRMVQPAIDSAAAWAACCETPCQAWIAKGTYYVYESSVHDTIKLADRVQIYGSFSKEEGDPDERDIEANPTILDGRAGPDSEERVYHVVSAVPSHEDDVFMDVILDGLTITQGAAGGEISSWDASCAGMIWDIEGKLVVRKCTFTSNESIQGGSGACCSGAPTGALSVVMEDCLFEGNMGWMEGDLSYGGALKTAFLQEISINRCVFFKNNADKGSAIVAFVDYGPAMQVTIENSIFRSNIANWGGRLFEFISFSISPDSYVDIFHSVMYGNTSLGPPGEEGWARDVFQVKVHNSISIDSTPFYSEWDHSLTDLTDLDGEGNFWADPLFVDPENGDFRLQPGSPCIDAADGTVAPEFDFLGNPRVDDPASPNTGLGPPWADIGAFEYQPE